MDHQNGMGTDGNGPAGHATGGRGSLAPRARTRGRRVARAVAWGSLAVVVLTAGTALWLYSRLNGQITRIDLEQALGDNRPQKVASGAKDILVLGSDSRAGANGELDHAAVGGARSDTAMLIHIPEGRRKAVAVSIPRDTLVTRPACRKEDGTAVPEARRVMFNSVYTQAGPACVVSAVEQMSGIRIDHLVVVDFAGFKDLVDALGGVTVTLDRPIDDGKSGFRLAAGSHRLDGTQSLRFVRTRYGYGDGSDLGRIGLQQQFLLATLTEIKKQDAFGNPARLYRLADTGTRCLTTDSGLGSLTALIDFGRSIRGIDAATMETITLPVVPDKADPNRVVAVEAAADALWKALREDTQIPGEAKK